MNDDFQQHEPFIDNIQMTGGDELVDVDGHFHLVGVFYASICCPRCKRVLMSPGGDTGMVWLCPGCSWTYAIGVDGYDYGSAGEDDYGYAEGI